MKDRLMDPWVVVSPQGVQFLGYAVDETTAWRYATQSCEPRASVEVYKSRGWYAAPATVTWQKPAPTIDLFAAPATPEVDLFK